MQRDVLTKLGDVAIKLRNVLTTLRNAYCVETVDISENGAT